MTETLDLSSALGLRVANTDALALRIANVDVWSASLPPYSYSENFTGSGGGWAAISGPATLTWNNNTPDTGYHLRLAITSGSGTGVAGITLTGFNPGKSYLFSAELSRSNATTVTNLSVGADGSWGTVITPAMNTFASASHTFTASSSSHSIQYRGSFSGAGTRVARIRAVTVVEL